MKRKAGVSIAIFVSLFSLAFALNSYTSRPFPSMPPESNENEYEIFQAETPMTDARPEPFSQGNTFEFIRELKMSRVHKKAAV